MLRIKKIHIGKNIIKGSTSIILSENLTQKELLFIKNMVCSDFIEEYDELAESKKQVESYVKTKVKKEKDELDNQKESEK
jgi:hypothetical protein